MGWLDQLMVSLSGQTSFRYEHELSAADTNLKLIASETSYNDDDGMGLPPAIRSFGDVIKFERVAIDAPDGTPLLRELSFEVLPGHSVMLMGPNGSGKSSLLRVLAGLWPVVVRPKSDQIGGNCCWHHEFLLCMSILILFILDLYRLAQHAWQARNESYSCNLTLKAKLLIYPLAIGFGKY